MFPVEGYKDALLVRKVPCWRLEMCPVVGLLCFSVSFTLGKSAEL